MGVEIPIEAEFACNISYDMDIACLRIFGRISRYVSVSDMAKKGVTMKVVDKKTGKEYFLNSEDVDE
jgi:hypothetical protein